MPIGGSTQTTYTINIRVGVYISQWRPRGSGLSDSARVSQHFKSTKIFRSASFSILTSTGSKIKYFNSVPQKIYRNTFR